MDLKSEGLDILRESFYMINDHRISFAECNVMLALQP